MNRIRRKTVALICGSVLVLAPGSRAQSPEGTGAPAVAIGGSVEAGRDVRGEALLERVVLVGASVTDGFGLLGEVRAKVDLGDFLTAMLDADRQPLACYGDSWFFRSPLERGEKAIGRVLEDQPTLVIAVDFLFWFGYGYQSGPASRLALLERGLALLDQLDCPVVIGDFPNIERALQGKGPFGQPMVTRPMVPSPETLVKLNERLYGWAGERSHVTVTPMADVLRKVHAGESFAVRGNTFEAGADGSLLQSDLLHLTAEGTTGLLLLAVDGLVRELEVPSEAFFWESAAVRERLWAATQEERAKNEEKDRRRAERRGRSKSSGDQR